MQTSKHYREIPYNYTSFTDRNIIDYFLGEEAWQQLEALRSQRQQGHSARMMYEILGDMWVITRNPYIQDDLLQSKRRWQSLHHALLNRLNLFQQRMQGNLAAVPIYEKLQQAIRHFTDNLQHQKQLRKRVLKTLSKYTRKDNICFDGLSRIAHATDATDWRVEYPFVVIKPDDEKSLPNIIKACIECGLTVIPRGGGTGYTGAAIPLTPNSVVINTEKLDRIDTLHIENDKVASVNVQTGVVTRRVSDLAKQHGYVFAVDPTSQDASTIGGNIAMNAGGKKAVLWGTTLDNLLSWKMITPDHQWCEVKRLNHNYGKIHEQAQVQFEVNHYDRDHGKLIAEPKIITVPGANLRKQGLGKDVTDKFLAGIPGVQKEGCDGFITSAKFILHKPPEHILTLCLEFFGNNLSEAVPAIVEIRNLLESTDNVLLAGLEHLDERYLKAVKYTTKAPRSERPKMILLADIVSDDSTLLQHTAAKMVQLTNTRNGEGFIATSDTARAKFWLDRTRTAAIAAHTNAFKINEDVVIPLENLAAYNDGIERINIEQSLKNKLAIAHALQSYLQQLTAKDDSLLYDKIETAKTFITTAITEWKTISDNLDQHFIGLQNRELRVSYRRSIKKPLHHLFSGEDYEATRKQINSIHRKILSGRLFVALHMHAGDGNVHTNIPVNSNDPEMMAEAEKIVERVMHLARSLNGVISGEHGIGITKMPFLDPETITAFKDYKSKVDPDGHFNRGKLLSNIGLEKAYTPSLRLLQQEALLLEASELGDLNKSIKNCLRCGKCKPVCMTQIPKANMYYSPRDKILATGALIEAFLYEEQTRRGVSLTHFEEFNDVADHCTTCHKCFNPCPVNIDFGDVSIKMRNILHARGQKKFSLNTKLALWFLNVTDPATIKTLRTLLIKWGFAGQRLFYHLYSKLKPKKVSQPSSTTGKTPVKEQVIYFIKRPMPKSIPSKTARALIGAEDDKTVAIIRDSQKINDDSDAVFYFPGCGSERLFSQIGLATFAMLYHIGAQTVLPPGYLCCGYPQTAAGDHKKGEEISIANRVLFHRMANSVNYLQIKTVVVSCGTCIDQLAKYQLDKIFPGARLMDIHEYLMEKEVHIHSDEKYLYHDPCHSPMKLYAPEKVASTLMGQEIASSKFCCGDAGTLSVSRPDIANQLKYRKQKEITANVEAITADNPKQTVKMLTSCPACLKGLASYTPSTGIKPEYIVVELARKMLGKDWQSDFVRKVQHGGVERILL